MTDQQAKQILDILSSSTFETFHQGTLENYITNWNGTSGELNECLEEIKYLFRNLK